MTRLYSYILRSDGGAAPNPFWGLCTLAICKPAIRRTARKGDWIVGTGSKNSELKDGHIYDLSDSLVYAMKVTETMTLSKYDEFCRQKLKDKMPSWFSKDWRKRMGDCIYDFSAGSDPTLRKGVHNEKNRSRDLGGLNVLLSDHFYYFGEEPRVIPSNLKEIVKRNQGHLKIDNADLISYFETWIQTFKKNKVYADPQLRYQFDLAPSEDVMVQCAREHLKDDESDVEEIIC